MPIKTRCSSGPQFKQHRYNLISFAAVQRESEMQKLVPSIAGLYCDITLLARVGMETATKTINRQAILYSSSGLIFSVTNQKN